MQNQLLLIEDVEDLGRSGDVVSVKPGYARNFLLPQKKAIVADTYTLRLQAKLKSERAKQAELDRQEAESYAKKIDGMVLTIEVKVDPDGNMYGSVGATDLIHRLENEGIKLEKRNFVLTHSIKALGVHPVQLKLKEGVPAQITLHIVSEGYVPLEEEEVEVEAPAEE
jgi:large subunit ribosomal protein L9